MAKDSKVRLMSEGDEFNSRQWFETGRVSGAAKVIFRHVFAFDLCQEI